jgi:hypothetical protein
MVEDLGYESVEQFVADAPTLFARVPVRSVAIGCLVTGAFGETDWLRVLADMPELLRLRELRLQNRWMPVPEDSFGWFVTSPHLANLEVLAIREAALTDEDMGTFSCTDSLEQLEELGLSGNQLTVAGALRVLRTPQLPNLCRLGLAYNDIVENRQRGSLWMQLRDELFARFDNTAALELVV